MTWYFFESGEETASEEGVECLVVVGRLALGVPPNTRGEAVEGAVVGGCCLRCFREGSGEALLAWGVDGVAVVVEVVVVVATVSSAGSIVAIFFICCHLTLTLSFLPPKKNNND